MESQNFLGWKGLQSSFCSMPCAKSRAISFKILKIDRGEAKVRNPLPKKKIFQRDVDQKNPLRHYIQVSIQILWIFLNNSQVSEGFFLSYVHWQQMGPSIRFPFKTSHLMQFLHIPCAWEGMPVLSALEHKAGVTSLLLKPLITQPGNNSYLHHHHHHFFPEPTSVRWLCLTRWAWKFINKPWLGFIFLSSFLQL